MDPGLHRAHGFELALQQSQRSAHGGIGPHVAHLHVCNGTQAAGLIGNALKQTGQNLRGLFVWQGHDVVAHGAGWHIHISPLAGCDWGVITLDAQSTGLYATRQVGQGSCVHQLTDDGGACSCVPADYMNEAKAINPKPRNVCVLYKMLTAQFKLVIFIPVSAY